MLAVVLAQDSLTPVELHLLLNLTASVVPYVGCLVNACMNLEICCTYGCQCIHFTDIKFTISTPPHTQHSSAHHVTQQHQAHRVSEFQTVTVTVNKKLLEK